MEEIINKIKKHLEELNNKKFINNLFIILLLSIIFLIGVNFLLGNKKESKSEEPSKVAKEIYNQSDHSVYLEQKLKNILEKLKGVGEVNVMITLEDTIEKLPATNTQTTKEVTKEIDAEGGTREVNREDTNIQMVSSTSDSSLVVLKEVNPTVRGVIVVAEGVDDILVLERVYEAVKTVLGISGNKVQVYSSK